MSRVDNLIEEIMRQHPGRSKVARYIYFEEVHQHLAPLARDLENELANANKEIISLKEQLYLRKK